jgi:predicted homoserine dehydrogenase-like protein
VFAYAKRDLRAGEALDGIGGYACYGMIDNCPDPEAHRGLPICLAEDVALTRGVRSGEPILLDAVAFDPAAFVFDLFRQSQEASRRATLE